MLPLLQVLDRRDKTDKNQEVSFSTTKTTNSEWHPLNLLLNRKFSNIKPKFQFLERQKKTLSLVSTRRRLLEPTCTYNFKMKQKRMMLENNWQIVIILTSEKPAGKPVKNVKQASCIQQYKAESTNKQRHSKIKLNQLSCPGPHKRALQVPQRNKTPFSQVT